MYVNLTFTDPDWPQATITAMADFAAQHRDELRAFFFYDRLTSEIYSAMGDHGWVGPFTPQDEGGSGLGVAEYCLIEEEVGRLGLVSPQISIQGQRWLIDWATPEQRERYLPGMARGTLIFSESISEPGVGSSMKLMRSTAEHDGDDWIINGAKTHVNLGCESQVTLVYAIAPEGITAFLVDTDLPGVSTTHTDPIGLRLIPTADVMLNNVRVPGSALLGEAGRGMDTFFSTFNMSRLGNASELIGFGRRALADAIAYGSGREVGDSVVTDFQGIQWTVADCYSDLYGASLARDHAANLHDAGKDVALATTLAKKMAISASEHAVNEAFALTGGHGLYTDTDYGQLLHDMKVLRVAGGSLEVLRNYVARRVLRADDYEGLG
ncbi:MAG: acyl-CoA dehydrogenase [Acidimicrobiaceae bacterium]|nr:acyl-CoA dehydrogenase [Acidimicrobiaceae bacterium]